MAFIIFFIFFLKKFEKVEKTGIISTKFSLKCTPSVILGIFLHLMHEKISIIIEQAHLWVSHCQLFQEGMLAL